jgi:quinol monooxygenase YgiN
MDAGKQIIQVNEYNLIDSADTFVAAITALTQRTRDEGHPGVRSYHFYVNRDEKTAGATIVYADADAWLAHHQIAYQWEEMPVLQATVSLKRLILLGPLSEELDQSLANAGISFSHYDTLAAGFSRE